MNANIDTTLYFKYFETLFNNAKQNAVLIMDTDGTVTSINTAFTRCFGYKEKDILEKNASVLFTEEDQKDGLFEKELSTVLREGQAFDNNYLVNKDKTITWVSGESLLVKNNEGGASILKVIQNIHKRKVSELALRHLNDFNESILGSIEDVVIVLDEKMNVVKANNAFVNLFKHGAPDISSLNFADLIKSYDTNNYLLENIDSVIRKKRSFSNKQIEIDTLAGDKRIFDVSCTPMQSSGTNNVLMIVHDITVYKQLEKEREDVMGFVAHELRNPLSNIILCNEIMTEAIKDHHLEELNDVIQRSKNNVMRLNKMIAELYEATRVNSGYLQLEISAFNFGDMLKESITTVEVLQPAYHILVKGDENIEVYGDRYRLIQVVTNYLSNGIKYSNGKIEVTLNVQHDENSLTVSVKDEGLGISKEQLPYVFERFYRVEKTRDIEGIGLGLYLCRQIIHAHKGHVWVESKEGKGSTFYFSIPLKLTSVQ